MSPSDVWPWPHLRSQAKEKQKNSEETTNSYENWSQDSAAESRLPKRRVHAAVFEPRTVRISHLHALPTIIQHRRLLRHSITQTSYTKYCDSIKYICLVKSNQIKSNLFYHKFGTRRFDGGSWLQPCGHWQSKQILFFVAAWKTVQYTKFYANVKTEATSMNYMCRQCTF